MQRIDVEELYKRHPELKQEDVKVLQDWMGKQPHLPKVTGGKLFLSLNKLFSSSALTI